MPIRKLRGGLLPATGFFREQEWFASLARVVFPRLLTKAPGEPIRIWVAGCSTGEDAYSLAITLFEFMGDRTTSGIQILGTDVSAASVSKAFAGIYPEPLFGSVSPERLRRFFTKVQGGYQVSESLRDICVFARHDPCYDPPFSQLDLIACRNGLIGMSPALQKRVLALFHYALRPGGFLARGKSKTVSANSNLFVVADRKGAIYSSKPSRTAPAVVADFRRALQGRAPQAEPDSTSDSEKMAERIRWQYAPAALVVDTRLHILHFQGETSPYLAPSPGVASLRLLKMLRPELVADVRTALDRAKKEGVTVRTEGILLVDDGKSRTVDLAVVPIRARAGKGCDFLVVFQDAGSHAPSPAPPGRVRQTGSSCDAEMAAQLRPELSRGYSLSIIEDQKVSKSAWRNQESVSTNQASPSANEASDLSSLLVGVDIPIVIIGDDRRIRRFTPMAEKTLNLISSDVGRPISDICPNVNLPDLDQLISEVINHGRSVERDVQDRDGRWYSLRLGPYRTAENKIDGVLMALVDIDSIKRGLEEIRRSRDDVAAEQDFSAALLDLVSAPVVVRNPDGRIVIFNRAAQQACGYSPEEPGDRKAWDSLVAPEHRRVAQAAFRKVCRGADEPVCQEAYWVAKDGTRRLISWTSTALRGADGSVRHIISTGLDLTESKLSADALRASEAALRASHSGLRALAANLLTAQEEERRRISRDLHDDINQKLAMLAVEAESLERNHTRLDRTVRERLQALRARVIQLSDDVRRTAYQLHPSSLEHLGLSAALKSFCADFTAQESIRIRLRDHNVPKSVPPDVALCLYRITQEALHNVARHSRARSVQLTLSATGGGLRLRIDDDGVGFKRGSAKRKVGLGIASMEERARLVGGTVSVSSRPSRGTRIDVRIPAPSKAL